jgi:hypothetical protein
MRAYAVDSDKGLRVKLVKLASMIGKERRKEMSLPERLDACVDHLCGCTPHYIAHVTWTRRRAAHVPARWDAWRGGAKMISNSSRC